MPKLQSALPCSFTLLLLAVNCQLNRWFVFEALLSLRVVVVAVGILVKIAVVVNFCLGMHTAMRVSGLVCLFACLLCVCWFVRLFIVHWLSFRFACFVSFRFVSFRFMLFPDPTGLVAAAVATVFGSLCLLSALGALP